jgi:hypothetical protein
MRLRFLHKWLFWTPLAVLLLPLPSASSDVPPADELPLEAEVVLTDPFALVPATNSVGRGQIVHGRGSSGVRAWPRVPHTDEAYGVTIPQPGGGYAGSGRRSTC